MTDFLLLETGDVLLLETGDKVLLESAGGGGSTYTLTADAGSYAITGVSATLKRTYVWAVAAGSYLITGQDVTFSNVRSLTLTADPGSYVITGAFAALRYSGAPVTATRGRQQRGRHRGR